MFEYPESIFLYQFLKLKECLNTMEPSRPLFHQIKFLISYLFFGGEGFQGPFFSSYKLRIRNFPLKETLTGTVDSENHHSENSRMFVCRQTSCQFYYFILRLIISPNFRVSVAADQLVRMYTTSPSWTTQLAHSGRHGRNHQDPALATR